MSDVCRFLWFGLVEGCRAELWSRMLMFFASVTLKVTSGHLKLSYHEILPLNTCSTQ